MVQIIFQLGYSKSEKALQRNYQQIPYNYFTPRQLGSIYESLLEYQLDVSKETMVYRRKGKYKKWDKLTAEIKKKLKGFEPIIKREQLFFTPDNSERKATGSYYTPDYIVQYIVKETIGPLCEKKSSQEILDLKVCDPAMGSGHFLNGALNFLTKKYLEALELEKSSEEIPTRAEAKRIVLDKCIFGVDINPRAVKLAKMSLWLESVHPGKKLERLDDQLFCGDSIFEKYKSSFQWENILKSKNIDRFDAFIGNPPYFLLDDLYGYGSLESSYLKKQFDRIYRDKTDILFYFLYLGIRYSKNFGWIIKRTIIEAAKADGIRGQIAKSGKTLHILDFGEYQVFQPQASVTSAIIVGSENKRNEDVTMVKVATVQNGNRKDVDKTFGKAIVSDVSEGNATSSLSLFSIASNELGNQPWSFKSSEDKQIYEKLTHSCRQLKDFFAVSQGMQTGANNIFWWLH